MLLLHVKSSKKGTYIEVQNGDKAYRSRDLTETEVTFYCKEVVLAIMASAATGIPALDKALPDPTELKKPLKDGIGLTDDHRKLIQHKDGVETVLDEGPRYLVSDALKIHVGHAIRKGTIIKGDV